MHIVLEHQSQQYYQPQQVSDTVHTKNARINTMQNF